MTIKNKKRITKGKKFLPNFRPTYIQVIGIGRDGIPSVLNITEPIQFETDCMRIFVALP